MAYVAPLGNAIYFQRTGGFSYAPPVGTAVIFNRVKRAVAGGSYSPSGLGSAQHGASCDGAGTYSISGQAVGYLNVLAVGSGAYLVNGEALGIVTVFGAGLGTYVPSGIASATFTALLPVCVGAGTYRPHGAGYEIPPTAAGRGKYTLNGQAVISHGVIGYGSGVFRVTGRAYSSHGRAAVGVGKYTTRGVGYAYCGAIAIGYGSYVVSGSAMAISTIGYRAQGAGIYHPTGSSTPRFGPDDPMPDMSIFVSTKSRNVYVVQ